MRHYGERVYWTRGKDGEFHNVQPDHAVLEAPYAVASARTVTAEDLVGIHTRNEAGVVENTLTTPDSSEKGTEAAPQADSAPDQLSEVRSRLGLGPKE